VTEPRFPYWWVHYDTEAVLRDHEGEFTVAYIVTGQDSKKFGWVVGFNRAGVSALPRYAGFWFAVGEAPSLDSAKRGLSAAVARAEKLCRTH
jgi:hypothetical protein